MDRAQQYAERRGLTLETRPLGAGVHGIVLSAVCQSEIGKSALKVFEQSAHYRRERDVYLRLKKHHVVAVREHHVPLLLGCDDDLWIVEMTIVTRPFALDFAGAYLDERPDYSAEVWDEWRAEKREQFESRWGEVQAIIGALERFGIYLADVNPGNIAFRE